MFWRVPSLVVISPQSVHFWAFANVPLMPTIL